MLDFGWSKREKILVSLLVTVLILFAFFFLMDRKEKDPLEGVFQEYEEIQKKPLSKVDSKQQKNAEEIWVDVKGAVQKPGIYKVKKDARVFEVIEKAGGAGKEAETNHMNLVEVIEDGSVLYIPKKGEKPDEYIGGTNSINGTGGKININTATQQELETLSGIGATKAQKIVEYRKKHGRFKRISDLQNISGFKEKTIAKFKDQITVR